MSRLSVVTIVGTRPEIIRLSRVLSLLDDLTQHRLVHTGQNYDDSLNEVFFRDLGLRPPDVHLGVRTDRLGNMLGDTLANIEPVLEEHRPDAVLILGDTNSCIAAVMAKRMRIPVYHMEAGNRSFDQNVPEEVNRRLIDHVADFNLVYTEHARRNLLAEGIAARRIYLTGSPLCEVLEHFRPAIERATVLSAADLNPGDYFLVSMHRQENVDDQERLLQLLEALDGLAETWQLPVVVSTHPRTRCRLDAVSGSRIGDIRFLPPFGFLDYNKLQLHARCVLSDSGSISEESLILGFPAVTMRDAIERPEALDAGGIVTTGVAPDSIIHGVQVALALHEKGPRSLPDEYRVRDCARRVVNLITSTAKLSNTWDAVREPPAFW